MITTIMLGGFVCPLYGIREKGVRGIDDVRQQ